jgi:hypothetical protein
MLNAETEVDQRICSHPGCNALAEATLGFHYGSRLVWFEELKREFELDRYDLCGFHLDGFAAPRGWDIQDRRVAASG